jgi:hypothetical protein
MEREVIERVVVLTVMEMRAVKSPVEEVAVMRWFWRMSEEGGWVPSGDGVGGRRVIVEVNERGVKSRR